MLFCKLVQEAKKVDPSSDTSNFDYIITAANSFFTEWEKMQRPLLVILRDFLFLEGVGVLVIIKHFLLHHHLVNPFDLQVQATCFEEGWCGRR